MQKYWNNYRIPSIRLKGYDYSKDGFYFVTICANGHQCLFGGNGNTSISNGILKNNSVETGLRPVSTGIILSDAGKILMDCWYDLPNHYANIVLDEFVIMPDHIHGIIQIKNHPGMKTRHGLSEFIRAFKSFSTRRINEFRKTKKPEIWQKRFHEHIIRSYAELTRIRLYIRNNPVKHLNHNA